DLTINQADMTTLTESACDSYTWSENGMTYTTSGQYIESFTNQAGCDSIITLDLTIGATDSIVLNESACNEYTWSENGTTYTTSGQYVESFTNTSGCDSVMVLNLTINPIDLTVTDNGSGMFTANEPNATYQWIDCNTNTVITGETSQDFIPTYNGDFAVIIDNTNCSDTSDCVTIGNVGLDKNSLNAFTLYPNPSNGEFNIEFNQSFTGTVKVNDVTGKTVLHTNVYNSTISKINLSKVNEGIYFVKIISDNGYVSTKKVHIQ
uniref:T9SS type A sorting domain-containing protein n=1 Tax=Brumimicrobium mesophilum TaxID=392717 RepID=UPI00131EC267